MVWPCRYFETLSYRPIFKDYFRRGARWTAAPKPQITDELFDPARFAASPCACGLNHPNHTALLPEKTGHPPGRGNLTGLWQMRIRYSLLT